MEKGSTIEAIFLKNSLTAIAGGQWLRIYVFEMDGRLLGKERLPNMQRCS